MDWRYNKLQFAYAFCTSEVNETQKTCLSRSVTARMVAPDIEHHTQWKSMGLFSIYSKN